MTYLLMDIGHSRIKMATLRQTLSTIQSFSHIKKLTCLKIKPKKIIIASVVSSDFNQKISQFCQQHFHQTPLFLTTEKEQLGLTNGYYQFKQLGVDRWLAMLAAWCQFQTALCIVDCGSAVTLDIINSKGEHQGGLILPGLKLMQESLQSSTSLHFKENPIIEICAKETAGGIYSGCIQAITGTIERLIRLNPTVKVILCGGDADKISTLLPFQVNYQKDLIFKGIQLVIEDKAL